MKKQQYVMYTRVGRKEQLDRKKEEMKERFDNLFVSGILTEEEYDHFYNNLDQILEDEARRCRERIEASLRGKYK